jgi:hypothetical protein
LEDLQRAWLIQEQLVRKRGACDKSQALLLLVSVKQQREVRSWQVEEREVP